jgi:hypothetical protein
MMRLLGRSMRNNIFVVYQANHVHRSYTQYLARETASQGNRCICHGASVTVHLSLSRSWASETMKLNTIQNSAEPTIAPA